MTSALTTSVTDKRTNAFAMVRRINARNIACGPSYETVIAGPSHTLNLATKS